jgi:RsiW-degrading membrane proteinase PrsW (M82 family)
MWLGLVYTTDGQLFWSFVAGILPPLLWLWLWLKEDAHPEPRKRIIIAFLGGMAAVPLVVPFEKLAQMTVQNQTLVIILWAAIEELMKFGAAFITSLTRKDNDEPIDPVIYMITTALGFAALENVLYLINPIQTVGLAISIDTENLRFIGANLVHLVSSAAIGVSLGLSFWRGRFSKVIHFILGFCIAVSLHSLFNLFIMKSGNGDSQTVGIFFAVWIMIALLALFIEKVKTVTCEIQPMVRPDKFKPVKPKDKVYGDGGTYRLE